MSNEVSSPPNVYEQLRKQSSDASIALQWKPGEHPGVVIAIDSEKGGVGKTSTTTALAAVAAAHGHKVLVIDLDPRATTTDEVGQYDRKEKKALPEWTVNDILAMDVADPSELVGTAAQAIVPAGDPWPENVHVLAAERNLSDRESDMKVGMEFRLMFALQGVAEKYDLVLIDMPPRSGGQLVKTAFNAATHALIPATLEQDGLVGAQDALRSLRFHNMYAKRPINIVGVFRNIVDGRQTSLGALYDDRLHEEFGDLILDAIVGMYVVRKEARAANIPITADPNAPEIVKLTRGYIKVLNAVKESL